MNAYASLTTLKSRLGITGTGDDTTLRLLLEAVSRVIDTFCHRHFSVKAETRYFDGDGTGVLPIDDLLAMTSIKLDEDVDGLTWEKTLVAAVPDYFLYPLNKFPKTEIRLHREGDYAAFPAYHKTVEIVASWGYGDGVSASPYTDSLTTTNEVLTAIQSTVLVADGTKLSPGQTILVESEQMYIKSIATHTATVLRDVNGTTPATHATGKAIYIYQYPEGVMEGCLMQTARLWKRKDSAYASVITMPEMGQIEVFRGMDADIKLMLSPLIKMSNLVVAI